MKSFENIIQRYALDNPDFEYYLKHSKEIKNHEESHPDIAIECCTSLLQGLSKSICYKFDPTVNKKQFENSSIEYQVKEAFKLINNQSNVFEIDLPRACSTVARIAGELRNNRGDISHGKAVPKKLKSDASLAKLALDVTEAIARYMFAHLILLDDPQIRYSENEDFNSELDELGNSIGSTPYSKLLFENDFDAYVYELDQYNAKKEGTL